MYVCHLGQRLSIYTNMYLLTKPLSWLKKKKFFCQLVFLLLYVGLLVVVVTTLSYILDGDFRWNRTYVE